VDTASVKLSLDGAEVSAKVTKTGNTISVSYDPASDFATPSSHTAKLSFKSGSVQRDETWKFSVPPVTRDKTSGKLGFIVAGAKHTADAGGHSGKAGDYAMDFGAAAGVVNVVDASFLNDGAKADSMTFSVWEKLRNVRDASAFWGNSPSSNNSTRGWQAHIPWSNGNIYFDTAGCCTADSQRIDKAIAEFAGYTDATWWQSWHNFVFVKNGSVKQIYIDGQLFHEGGGDPLPTDFTNLILGGGPGTGDNRIDGLLDDVAIFKTGLTAAQVTALANGTAPNAVSGNPGLVAWWDFNDPVPAGPSLGNLKAALTSAGKVKITFEGSGVVQSSDKVEGPYADTTLKSGDEVAASGAAKFFRPKN